MTNEAWIALSAILVSVVMTGCTAFAGLLWWLITREIRARDKKIEDQDKKLEDQGRDIESLRLKMVQVVTTLTNRGYIAPSERTLRFPSPPPHASEDTA